MIKTVVIVYDQAYVSGGAAKIAINTAILLKKRGYRVIYFSALGPTEKTLTENGVEVICIGGKHIGKTKNPIALLQGIWNRYAQSSLDAVLKTLDKDETVVHIHGWTKCLSASIFAACNQNHIKTYITLHEYFSICPNGGVFDYKSNKICTLKPCGLRCYLHNCDKQNYLYKVYRDVRQMFTNRMLYKLRPNVIYISEFSKKILEEHIQFQKKSFLIENFVEIQDTIKVNAAQNTDYLFIGRVSKEKGPDLFCKAIEETGVQGVIIGDGPELTKLMENYPNITFTGWLSPNEMEPYIQNARCLVVSSEWYETMGLTIIEMQAKGVPCIVPIQCAGSEYIKDQKSGILYQIGDLESLKSAIEKTKSGQYLEMLSDNFYMDYDPYRFNMERYFEGLTNAYKS